MFGIQYYECDKRNRWIYNQIHNVEMYINYKYEPKYHFKQWAKIFLKYRIFFTILPQITSFQFYW